MKLKLIMVSSGEYSDYGVQGHYWVPADFDDAAAVKQAYLDYHAAWKAKKYRSVASFFEDLVKAAGGEEAEVEEIYL